MSLEGYKIARLKLQKKKTPKAPLYPLSHLEDKWYNVLQTSDKQEQDGLQKNALKNMRRK